VEKFLRETASVGRFKAVNRTTHPDSFHAQRKELPHIVAKLQAQRQQLQDTLVRNHHKLNGSFSEYLRSEAQASRSGHLQRRVTKLKKI
jgi:exonuclease VII small subunit